MVEVIKSSEPRTAYEIGVAMGRRSVKKLEDRLLTLPNVHSFDHISALDELEMARLKLRQLHRRKNVGLLQ